jgi:hypothetical protein
MTRHMACLFYRLVMKGQTWVDLGAAVFEGRRQERQFATLQRKDLYFGMTLVPAA